MTPEELIKALEGFAKLVCEFEARAHYEIVKMHELRARIAETQRWLQQVENVEGAGERLAFEGRAMRSTAQASFLSNSNPSR